VAAMGTGGERELPWDGHEGWLLGRFGFLFPRFFGNFFIMEKVT